MMRNDPEKSQERGIYLECGDCGRTQLLPFTTEKRTEVDITEITGWTSPPVRCCDCSGKSFIDECDRCGEPESLCECDDWPTE